MASSYTTSLRLTLPVQGELPASWGNTVNTGVTDLVDAAVAGTAAVTLSSTTYTLTSTNGASDEARRMFITFTGTPGGAATVTCPAVSKLYVVTNNTTGGFAVTLKTASGSGIAVPNGKRMMLYCNATDVIDGENYISSLTLGTALPVASGGTGAATLTANNVLLGNGTSALQAVAPGTNGNVLTSNGTTWSSAAPATLGVASISFGSTGLTPSTATTGIVSVAGTLAVANGGTGATTSTGSGSVVLATSPTLSNPTLADSTLLRAMVKDSGYVYFNSGTTSALDYVNGSHQRWAPTGTVTLSVTNWPPTGNLGELLIEGVNLGAATITWPTVNWIQPSGVTTTSISTYLTALARTLQTSGTDFALIWTRDAGTTLYGKLL